MRNKIIESVKIEDFAAEARCIARIDGQVVFVEDTAPGDVVDIRITRKKKNYLEARPLNFHSYSAFRANPFCEHYEDCGGCKWQHVQYEKQLESKYKQIKDQLNALAI